MKQTPAVLPVALGLCLVLVGASARAVAPTAGFGGALDFDGESNVVVIANHADLCMTDNYTIEAWICPRSFDWLSGIVSKYHTGGANGFTLRLTPNTPYTGINFDEADTGTGILEPDKWYHVAAVNSGGSRTLYINGVSQPLSGTPIDIQSNDNPVIIGADFYPSESDRLFDGRIDEVRIWGAALSQSTITNWMFRQADSTHPSWAVLAAYYRMNDGAGLTASDSSGKDHPGALSNVTAAAWTGSDAQHWYVAAGGSVTGRLVGSDDDGASADGTDWTLKFELATTQTLQGTVSILTNNAFNYTSTSTISGVERLPYRCQDTSATWSTYATAVVHIAGIDPIVVITSRFGVLQPAVTSVSIGGTNNAAVVGQMWWTNELTATGGTFAAAAVWTIPSVPLAAGDNSIIVRGSNYGNFVAESRLAVLRCGPGILHAWDFYGYGGYEASVPTVYSAPELQQGTILRGPDLYPEADPDAFFSTNWSGSSDSYVEFAVEPRSGYFCAITSLTFVIYRRSAGDFNYWLRSSLDGFDNNLGNGDFYDDNPTSRWETFDLSSRPEFNSLMTTVVFRLYGQVYSSGPDAGLKGAGADVIVRGTLWPDPWGAQGQLLAWDFAGKAGDETTVNATTVNSGLVATAISRGPGLTAVARTNTFNAQGWTYAGFQSDDYFQFAIQPLPGFRVAVTAASYRLRLSDDIQGADYIYIDFRSDQDSYTGNLDSWQAFNVDPPTGGVPRAFAVTSPAFDGLSTAVTFRMYGYNKSAGPDAGLGGTGADLALWGRVWFDYTGDDDGDGMPNEWEFVETGTATGAVRGLDGDGDRVADDHEWIAGTKPRDSNSFLRFTRIVRTNSYTLTFPCVTGRVYTVESATNLPAPDAWSVLPDLSEMPGSTNGTMSVTDTNDAPCGNYRIGVSFPPPPEEED